VSRKWRSRREGGPVCSGSPIVRTTVDGAPLLIILTQRVAVSAGVCMCTYEYGITTDSWLVASQPASVVGSGVG
jgi:hypothetical protein